MADPSPMIDAGHDIHIIQELVYYAGVRFRLIILAMKKPRKGLEKQQEWMQNYLRQELVCDCLLSSTIFLLTFFQFKYFVLTLIGHATAMGLQIDIPMSIRTLAERLLSDKAKFLSFILSSEVSKVLEVDCGEKTTTSLNWWDHDSFVRLNSYW